MPEITMIKLRAIRARFEDAAIAFASTVDAPKWDRNPGAESDLDANRAALLKAAIDYVAALATANDGKRVEKGLGAKWLIFMRANACMFAAALNELKKRPFAFIDELETKRVKIPRRKRTA